ncbi:MAG TPA: cohesin domain-containing protein [Burkholderiaceae bacterium]|jgi:hypothetical protein
MLRRIILGAALAVAGWLALFGDKTPSHEISEPVSRPIATLASTPSSVTTPQTIEAISRDNNIIGASPIAALRPREQLISRNREEAHVDGLFASHSWTPPPPPPLPPPPPPPPMAPPLPFVFIGKKFEDNKWEVYLAHGQQVFAVHEQSKLEGTYLVDSIKPPIMSLTYLPLKEAQTIVIGKDMSASPPNNANTNDAGTLADNQNPAEPSAFVKLAGPQKLKVGSTFDIQLVLEVKHAANGYSATIGFDNNVLEVTNVAEGDFLKKGGVQSAFTNGVQGNGQLAISGSRIGENRGITGQGILTTVSFRALTVSNETRVQLLNTAVENSAGQRLTTASPAPLLIMIQAQDQNAQ